MPCFESSFFARPHRTMSDAAFRAELLAAERTADRIAALAARMRAWLGRRPRMHRLRSVLRNFF